MRTFIICNLTPALNMFKSISQTYTMSKSCFTQLEILSGKSITNINICDLAINLEAKYMCDFRRLNEHIISLTTFLKQIFLAAEMCYILNNGLYYSKPGQHDKVKANLQHALICSRELLAKFEKIILSQAKAKYSIKANASYTFELINASVFVRIIESVYEQMNIFQQVSFVNKATEFKNTTMMLVRDIKILVS